MFCTKCGNFLADDARFCNSCGQPNKGYSEAISLKSTTDYKGNKILLYVWCSLILCYAAFNFWEIIRTPGYAFDAIDSISELISQLALLGFGIIPLCPIKPDLYRKLLMSAFILEAIRGIMVVAIHIQSLIHGFSTSLLFLFLLIFALWSALCIYIAYALAAGIQKLKAFKIVLLCGAIILSTLYIITRLFFVLNLVYSLYILGMSLTFFFPFIALPGVVKVKQ